MGPISQLVERVVNRSSQGGFTRDQLIDEGLIQWFFKDLRTAPLELSGYISGSSVSEDEDQAPGDVSQVGQVNRSVVPSTLLCRQGVGD
jgi:hypothetical protein